MEEKESITFFFFTWHKPSWLGSIKSIQLIHTKHKTIY